MIPLLEKPISLAHQIQNVTCNPFCSILDHNYKKYPLLPLPWVERVPDAFAEEVVAQDRDEDGETGESGEPPGDLDIVLAGR